MDPNAFLRLGELIDKIGFEIVYMPEDGREIKIKSNDVNRPGLMLAGFSEYFDQSRLQIMGMAEFSFLGGMSPKKKNEALDRLFGFKFPALIITRDLDPYPEIIINAQKHRVPVLRTAVHTSALITEMIPFLNSFLSKRETRHAVLVEMYGEGILLMGESGVGKSETAMELIKRGHTLISDDAVDIRKISADTLVGTAPDLIKHFIELRGVGIINVRQIFGIGAVKDSSNIDMIINLENWDGDKAYDRLGLDTQYTSILDISVPTLTIPVKPGRNLAIIIEVAAMNNRQKRMGYNAAEDLTERMNQLMGLAE